MTDSRTHEVHIFCTSRSRKLRRLVQALPNLRPNRQCDPANVPPGSVCYQYPNGQEREFETAADAEGLAYEWGVGGTNYKCLFALGSYLYTAKDSPEFQVFDISDPEAPTSVATLNLQGTPTALWVDAFTAYVVDSDGNFYVINIDDPTAPYIYPNGIAQTGSNWSHLKVSGDLAVLSGPAASLFWLYNPTTRPPMEVRESEQPGSAVSLQGRRLFVGDTTGNPRALLRNYRVGGFRCSAIAADRFQGDEIAVEQVNARHGYYAGEIVADMIGAMGGAGDADSGVVYAANYFKLGTKFIFWSDAVADPNTVFTATLSSLFLASDGTVWRNTDGATAWAAM